MCVMDCGIYINVDNGNHKGIHRHKEVKVERLGDYCVNIKIDEYPLSKMKKDISIDNSYVSIFYDIHK